jgi:hypothetical protein
METVSNNDFIPITRDGFIKLAGEDEYRILVSQIFDYCEFIDKDAPDTKFIKISIKESKTTYESYETIETFEAKLRAAAQCPVNNFPAYMLPQTEIDAFRTSQTVSTCNNDKPMD